MKVQYSAIALIRNDINNSVIYSSNAALLSCRGPTICRGHPVLWIVVRYVTDHKFFGVSKFFDHSNIGAKIHRLKKFQISDIFTGIRNTVIISIYL
jgi:hypothetical protein